MMNRKIASLHSTESPKQAQSWRAGFRKPDENWRQSQPVLCSKHWRIDQIADKRYETLLSDEIAHITLDEFWNTNKFDDLLIDMCDVTELN